MRFDGDGDLTAFEAKLAAETGCRTVDLTSRPSRLDANRLYEQLGFIRRETNVYRISLES